MASVLALFESLASPDIDSSSLTAIEFPDHAPHKLCKNGSGHPVVLIRESEGHPILTPLPVRTEFVHVAYSGRYEVVEDAGKSSTGIYTAVTCTSEDVLLLRYFLNVVAALLDSAGEAPTAKQLEEVIRSVVRLFRNMAQPSAATVQGVWAELLLIATSSDKSLLARTWHSNPADRYDFMLGADRLEVKSSGQRVRRHHFGLEQLSPPQGTTLWIASVFVESAGGGVSLGNLIEMACDGLAAEEAGRLRLVVAETLGSGLAFSLDRSFDLELATDSVQYFDYGVVPSVSRTLPVGVTEVRFVSDISSAQTVSPLIAQASVFFRSFPHVT
ncbi:MAG: PD-(D/E)XK motif protein [Chthoniobacterales bacterium]|nr:PD-(D/E)XK motif protein [Chthoniobacterales bacterium]